MANGAGTDFQRRIWFTALTGLSLLALFLVISSAAWLLVQGLLFFKPLLIPLAIAAVLAYIIDPVVEFFAARNFSRNRIIAVIFGITTLATSLCLVFIIPLLVREIGLFFGDLDNNWRSLNTHLLDFSRSFGNVFGEHPEWLEMARQKATDYLPTMSTQAGQYLLSGLQSISSVFTLLLGTAMIPLYLFYFLKERYAISTGWKSWVPLRKEWFREEIIHVLEEINKYMIAFFRGQVLVAVCIGVLTAIGLTLIGLPYGLLFGLMAGVLSIIPYLGYILSLVPAMLVGFIQTGSWQMPVGVFLVFAGVNVIEGFFITPKVQGERIGLHPLTIIVAILFWSQILGGLMGPLLAIPLTATLRVLAQRYIFNRGDDAEPEPEKAA